MTARTEPRTWATPRVFALGAAALVVAVFVAANAHLVFVAFTSHPDCALTPVTKGAVTYSAAKSSC